MKTQAMFTAVAAALSISAAQANPRIVSVEVHAQLLHEEVDVRIEKEVATVSGTYKFKNDSRGYVNLQIYLPVYAKEGTPEEQMRPVFKIDGEQELKARFIKAEWEKSDRNIKSFGELPQLEGQRVYWFLVPYIAQQPGQKDFTLGITYKQQLSGDKFIYTPLIPKQMKDHDYGSITLSADRPLKLVDSGKHDFVEKDGKLVVEPSDKRGIVVEAAKVKAKLP